MVSPFQAQQFSDPRVAVLQNAYNAQNKRDLQGMENRNRTLNSALAVGGSLLKDYAVRADDRSQGTNFLESVGAPEDFGGGKMGLKGILDYMTAQTNAQNAGSNIQGTVAKTLPYLTDEEAPAAAKAILDSIGLQGGFNWGGKKTPQATVFGNALGGQPAPQAAVDPNLVSSKNGTIAGPSGRIPGPLTTDDMVEETLNKITSGSANSPAGRDKELAKAKLATAEGKAVSSHMKAKIDLRRDNQMEFFATRPEDVLTNNFGEETPIVPNQITKSKIQKIRTAAQFNDSTVLGDMVGTGAANTQMASKLLDTGSSILDIYSKEGFTNNPDPVQALGQFANATGRIAESGLSKIGFGTSADNKDLSAAFGKFTNEDAKNLAKVLEGGGRLSDLDFTRALDQLGTMQMNADGFRRKYFTNVVPMIEDIITNQQALGNLDSAQAIANQLVQVGNKAGVVLTVGKDGVPRVTEYKDVGRGSTAKPVQTRQAAPAPRPVQQTRTPSGISRSRIQAAIDRQKQLQ